MSDINWYGMTAAMLALGLAIQSCIEASRRGSE